MSNLSSAALAAATTYLDAHGRPLDRARLRYLFGDGGPDAVLAALAAYQNEDGGFGHGLEPDLRSAASSAIATAMAADVLREVDASADDPIVARAVAYLLATFDATRSVWPIVTERVEDAPHAPWWAFAGTAKGFDGFVLNPTAALLGMLHDYPTLVPTELLERLTGIVAERIRSAPPAMEMHDFRACIVLAGARHLPTGARDDIVGELRRRARHTIELDRTAWDGYCLLPLGAITTPESPLAGAVDDADVAANLDLLLTRQRPDGSWPVAWEWSFVDEAAWRDAERDITSKQIVDNLLVLRSFDRL